MANKVCPDKFFSALAATSDELGCPGTCDFVLCAPEIMKCTSCGLGKTLDIGFTDVGWNPQEICDEVRSSSKLRYFQAIHKRCISSLKRGKVLDVGCAEGEFLDVLNGEGWKARGIELFRQSETNRNDIVYGDFITSEFREKFDLITLIHSFEHFQRPSAVLNKCRSVVEKNGHILVVVPNFESSWSQIMGPDWPWLNTKEHYYHYTERAISRMIERHGFKIVTACTYSAFTPSILNVYLSESGFVSGESTLLKPYRSALFRFSNYLKRPSNLYVDKMKRGAELRLLARCEAL